MKQEDVGKVIDRSFNAQSFIDNHAMRITDHYLHAREKHPYFCDWVGPKYQVTAEEKLGIKFGLAKAREFIKSEIEKQHLGWEALLHCKIYECVDALANGDKAQAVEELYDCISVCLRAIDVIEGRQALGKPKTIAEKYAEVRQRKESGKP